ncbi:hypothetical protein DPEC_G00357750 [Dallia pectoralis]|uniref:Uncharacterized protein n=1 Tax=Dallia pectoralis TaxID=75939 RepID=A0ACC2F085_DALPE|nr:hypothetical protein DPEC_G00357750 [Dallia pectoralis]
MSHNPLGPILPLGTLGPEPVATYITDMPSSLPLSSNHQGSTMPPAPKQMAQKLQRSYAGGDRFSSKGPGAMAGVSRTGTYPGPHYHTGTVPGPHLQHLQQHNQHQPQQHHPLAYSSNTIAAPRGMGGGSVLKGWDRTETVGRRKGYSTKRPQGTGDEFGELHSQSRTHNHSQHFLPTQPYFVTNSKTEVTV